MGTCCNRPRNNKLPEAPRNENYPTPNIEEENKVEVKKEEEVKECAGKPEKNEEVKGVIEAKEEKKQDIEKLPIKKKLTDKRLKLNKSTTVDLKEYSKYLDAAKEFFQSSPSTRKSLKSEKESKKLRLSVQEMPNLKAFYTTAIKEDYKIFIKNITEEIKKCSLVDPSGAISLPFLITGNSNIQIFSRNFLTVPLFNGKSIKEDTIWSQYILKELILANVEDEKNVINQINAFLIQESTNNLHLIGCINGNINNSEINFIFLKKDNQASRFNCVKLEMKNNSVISDPENSKQICSQITEMSKEKKIYRMNMPIFNTDFSAIKLQLLFYEEAEETLSKFETLEYPNTERLNEIIKENEDKGKTFKGVIIGLPTDSCLLFGS